MNLLGNGHVRSSLCELTPGLTLLWDESPGLFNLKAMEGGLSGSLSSRNSPASALWAWITVKAIGPDDPA